MRNLYYGKIGLRPCLLKAIVKIVPLNGPFKFKFKVVKIMAYTLTIDPVPLRQTLYNDDILIYHCITMVMNELWPDPLAKIKTHIKLKIYL